MKGMKIKTQTELPSTRKQKWTHIEDNSIGLQNDGNTMMHLSKWNIKEQCVW